MSLVVEGWQKYINQYSELPDQLKHAISQSRVEGKLVPPFDKLYEPFTRFRPENTRIVVLTGATQLVEVDLPHMQGILEIWPRLSMERGSPLAHAGLGWEQEISSLLDKISREIKYVVYILVGKDIWGYTKFIQETGNLILRTTKLGEEELEEANDYLVRKSRQPITNYLGS